MSQLEREALLAVLDDAIGRLVANGRNPSLLHKVREKIADTGD